MYEPIHPPDALERNTPPLKHLGSLAVDAVKVIALERQTKRQTKDEIRIENARKLRPPLSRILSLADMEVWLVQWRLSVPDETIQTVAIRVLSHKALSYYSSASDDEISASVDHRSPAILCLDFPLFSTL